MNRYDYPSKIYWNMQGWKVVSFPSTEHGAVLTNDIVFFVCVLVRVCEIIIPSNFKHISF